MPVHASAQPQVGLTGACMFDRRMYVRQTHVCLTVACMFDRRMVGAWYSPVWYGMEVGIAQYGIAQYGMLWKLV